MKTDKLTALLAAKDDALVDRIATIIQRGHIRGMTSHAIAEQVVAAIGDCTPPDESTPAGLLRLYKASLRSTSRT